MDKKVLSSLSLFLWEITLFADLLSGVISIVVEGKEERQQARLVEILPASFAAAQALARLAIC